MFRSWTLRATSFWPRGTGQAEDSSTTGEQGDDIGSKSPAVDEESIGVSYNVPPKAVADSRTSISDATEDTSASERDSVQGQCDDVEEGLRLRAHVDDMNRRIANEEQVPIEMQFEEAADWNDPEMDPLEWAVRRVVPIPKAYFWDTGNAELPLRIKAWHHTVSVLGAGVRLAEKIGLTVANITGLNSDEDLDYVTSTMTKEQWDAAQHVSEERQKEREQFLCQRE